MKILILTPEYPFPPQTGTSLIAYHHIRHLASRHEVDLLSLSTRAVPDLGDLPTMCRSVAVVALPGRTLRDRMRGLWDWRPWQVLRFESRAMHDAVREALATTAYDVALVQHTPMAQYLPADFDAASVWSLEDPPVLKNQRWMPYESVLRRWRTRERIARLKRYERRIAPRFDRVLMINEADARDYASLLPAAQLDWVPYGVDLGAAPAVGDAGREAGTIIITGNMNHPPNVEAVLHFCRDVYPLVKARIPSARLWLVGANPTPTIRALGVDASIRVTGRVDDVRRYLDRATVSVCAVKLRIGTQTKVLEAMAAGTPVVTTTAGNHGIGGRSGDGLYVADDPEEFAARVASLCAGERWVEMSVAARRFVADRFTWERSGERLEAILRELTRRAPARAAS